MGSLMGFYLHLGNLCRQSKVCWSKQGSRMRASAAKHRDPRIPTLKFIKDSQRFKELEELADGKPRVIQRDAQGLREMQSIHRNSSIFVSYYKVEAGSSLELSKACSTLSHNHVREHACCSCHCLRVHISCTLRQSKVFQNRVKVV